MNQMISLQVSENISSCHWTIYRSCSEKIVEGYDQEQIKKKQYFY